MSSEFPVGASNMPPPKTQKKLEINFKKINTEKLYKNYHKKPYCIISWDEFSNANGKCKTLGSLKFCSTEKWLYYVTDCVNGDTCIVDDIRKHFVEIGNCVQKINKGRICICSKKNSNYVGITPHFFKTYQEAEKFKSRYIKKLCKLTWNKRL